MPGFITRSWWLLALQGAAGILFGVAALFWPAITILVLVLLFGAWAVVDGVLSIAALGDRSHPAPDWLLVVQGIAGLLFGAFVLLRPSAAALVLITVVGAWALVVGAARIVAAIEFRRLIDGEWALALSGAIAVLVGLVFLFVPGAGALALVLYLAWFAILGGVLQLIAAGRLRSVGHVLHAA